jgi:uncharacterized membrane protein YdjX (TVP38/TMEM64 family)
MRLSRGRLAIAFLLVVLLATAVLVRPGDLLSRIHGVLYSPWFPLVLVGLYALRPFLGWPITALSGLVGFRYGLAVGLPLALVGVVATSLIPYAAGRRFDLDGPLVGRFVGGSRQYFGTAGDLRGVVAARLAPTPAEPVSAAAGFGGVPLGAFVLGTLIGELPWTIAAVTVGHSLNAYSVARVSIDWRLAVLGLLAALVLLAGPAYRVLENRRQIG